MALKLIPVALSVVCRSSSVVCRLCPPKLPETRKVFKKKHTCGLLLQNLAIHFNNYYKYKTDFIYLSLNHPSVKTNFVYTC